jgi:hypothetical protein
MIGAFSQLIIELLAIDYVSLLLRASNQFGDLSQRIGIDSMLSDIVKLIFHPTLL